MRAHDNTSWTRSGQRDTRWERNINALRAWTQNHDSPMAPIGATVTLDGDEVRVGSFVAYVRQRHRDGQLDDTRVAALESFPGWTWGALRPGPKGHAGRNEEIRRLRREGWTLTELAERFGMSRQRIHQIAPDLPDPVKHRQRVEERRAERRKAFEAEREAAARRAGASS